MHYRSMSSSLLDLHIQPMSLQIINLYYTVLQKSDLIPRLHPAQMLLTKFSKHKIIDTPGKNHSVADMLSCSFTKTKLHVNQLKHKQLPPQIDFAILQNHTLKPVHHLLNTKKFSLIKNRIPILFLLTMAQIHFLFVLMTKVKISS